LKGTAFRPYVNAFEMNAALADEGTHAAAGGSPQRLKPFKLAMSYGGAEAPPLQNKRKGLIGPQ
jgi:hypothetical protein